MCSAAALLFSGCVTGHRSFDIPVATAAGSASTKSDKFAIIEVTDDRHFENKPGDPSTPSIKGDVLSLSPAEKSTFIGRQRNGFGHAAGDIALPSGQTVQAKVSDLLAEGFRRRGYTMSASGDGVALPIKVEIRDFWSWTTPGFFALSFEARLNCKVIINRAGHDVVLEVKGYALNHGQLAKNKNWEEAY